MMRNHGTSGLRARSGNALILSVLILVSLSSVGLLAVQQSNTDLMVAGNVSRAAQARMAGEAGANHALTVVGERLQQYLTSLSNARIAGQTSRTMLVAGFSTNDPDPANSGDGTDYLPILLSGTPLDSVGRLGQGMMYQVQAQWLYETKGLVGYDVSKAGCHQAFDFTGTGAIPQQQSETVNDTLNPANGDAVAVRIVARALAGPWQCQLR